MSYLDILLQVEVVVRNCILHDHIEFCHFPVKSVSKVCCSVFVCVV